MIYSKHYAVVPEKSTSALIAAGTGTGKADWIKTNLLQMDENFIIKTGRRPHMKSSIPLGMNAVIF